MTIALDWMLLPCRISPSFSFTKSQALNLLSIARLNSARSRMFPDSSSLTRMVQTSSSLSGRFCPMSLPLFQAGLLVSIIIALILERLGARSAHWQISHYANSYLNRSVNLLTNKGLFGTASGFLIWLLLPVIAVACLFFLSDFALWQLVFNVAVLLVCFGCAKQRGLYKSYLNALT